jgi:hypothetical protein
LKDAEIFINQNNDLVSSQNYYYADNDLHYSVFENEGINILKLSKRALKEEKKVIEFLEEIDCYKPLSKHVKVTIYDTHNARNVDKRLSSQYKYVIRALICFLKKVKKSTEFNDLIEREVFSFLMKTELKFITSIEASYTLNNIQGLAEKEAVVHELANNIIFIKEDLSDDFLMFTLIAKTVNKYLNDIDVEDFITLLLDTKNNSEIRKRLNVKDIRWLDEREWLKIFNGEIEEELDIFKDEEEIKIEDDNTSVESMDISSSIIQKNDDISGSEDEKQSDFNEDETSLETETNETEYGTNPFPIPKAQSNITTKSTKNRRETGRSKSNFNSETSHRNNEKRTRNGSQERNIENGEWAEHAVFMRIIEDLKSKYESKNHRFEQSSTDFKIYTKSNSELIVRLIWQNIDRQGGYTINAFGRDLDLIYPKENKTIYIEVKGTIGDYGEYEISNRQWKDLIEKGNDYQIYFVARVGSENASYYSITNPYKEFLEGELEISSSVKFKLTRQR